MDLTITSASLSDALQWVTRAVPSRPAVPILSGVRLRCVDAGLSIEAPDLDRTFRSRLPARADEEGQVIIAGRLFAEVARALPSGDAHCWSTDTELILECGGLEYRFIRLPEDEYPEIEPAPDPAGTIDGDAFASAARRVVPAAGRDELLPVFTGVQISVDGQQMKLAATDRYWMAQINVDWSPATDNAAASLLVPARLLSEVCRAPGAPDRYGIGWGSETGHTAEYVGFRFAVGDELREVRARLLSGRFPSMAAVLEISTPVILWLRTDELRMAVERVRLAAEQRASIQLSIIDGDRIVVSSASDGRASAKASISLPAMKNPAGEVPHIAFNPQYLLDALNTYAAELLQLRISPKTRTAILHAATDDYAVADDDHIHVVKMMHAPC